MAALFLVVAVLAASCADSGDPVASERLPSAAVDPTPDLPEPSSRSLQPADPEALPVPVDAESAVPPLKLEIFSEFGYENPDGELILDVLERDYVYLALSIEDAEGRPVRGLRPTVEPERDSRFVPIAGEGAVSDDLGSYSFGLMGGSMGEERVEIVAGDVVDSLILNVISLRAAGFGWLGDIEGALDWSLLFQADIEWGEKQISATFPDEVLAYDGQTVKLAGFMLPLETTRKQSHFVLASSPPGCFFHIPGGPAGAVEVFASRPLDVSWDPIIVEGRFEVLETSEIDVLYRLHEARGVHPVPRLPGK